MQTRKVVTMLASVVALSGAAHAGEVAGVAVAPSAGADFLAKGKDTVSVRFAGRTEFDYTTQGADDGFSFRRLRLGAKAKLASGFTAETIADFANDAGRRGKSSGTTIRKAIISKQLTDTFSFSAGRDKVGFGYEETSSSSTGVYLERSELNNDLKSALGYGVQNGVTVSADLGSGITASVSMTDVTTGVGSNAAYFGRIQWANDTYTVGADYAKTDDNDGYTAYVNYNAAGFNVLGEYFDADLGGAASDIDGFAVRASYKFGSWEPVVRYSEYDKGASEIEETYVGLNYYIAPQVTLLTGYQEVDTDGTNAESITARLRLLW